MIMLASGSRLQGPDYDAKIWSFEKSFERSFEYFSNSFAKEVFKGLFKGLFKGPKFCIRIGTQVGRATRCPLHFIFFVFSLDGLVVLKNGAFSFIFLSGRRAEY